jgi:hypothetical protein
MRYDVFRVPEDSGDINHESDIPSVSPSLVAVLAFLLGGSPSALDGAGEDGAVFSTTLALGVVTLAFGVVTLAFGVVALAFGVVALAFGVLGQDRAGVSSSPSALGPLEAYLVLLGGLAGLPRLTSSGTLTQPCFAGQKGTILVL